MAFRAARVFTVSYCGSSCASSSSSGFSQFAALHANNHNSSSSQDNRNKDVLRRESMSSTLRPFCFGGSASASANRSSTIGYSASPFVQVGSATAPVPAGSYRERIQRLVGEAARADWHEMVKLFEQTDDDIVGGISISDAQRLHRLFYNHVMSDALAQFENELFQARQARRSSETGTTLDLSVSLQKEVYDIVKSRLALRMLWQAPVARCIETDGIDELVENLSNPSKFMEELQQAQISTLRKLSGSSKLFL